MAHEFDDPLQLAQNLIGFPSETPDVSGLQQYIAQGLKNLGYELKEFNQSGRLNLLAKLGNAKRSFYFSGHSDVVPAGDLSKWNSPPYQPTITDGYLVGRGASDMKGNVACFLAALARYQARFGIPKNISLGVLLAGDEEHDNANGTQIMVDYLRKSGDQIDYAIVAEPSSSEKLGDTIRIGRRGSQHAVITVFGIQGHVAYPEKAVNAIHSALPALSELASTPLDAGSNDFPPSSLQITLLEADSGASNVIPALLKCRLNIRYSPLHTPQSLRLHCEKIFERHKVKAEFQWHGDARPFLTQRGVFTAIVEQAIKTKFGISPKFDTGGGTSDARYIAATDTQVLEVGLINKTIHQTNEQIKVEHLEQLTELFVEIIAQLEKAV